MTSEEAREWLRSIKDNYIHGGDEAFDNARSEALSMADEALRCKPCEDAVSRDLMTNTLGATCIAKRDEKGDLVALCSIDHLPSATPCQREKDQNPEEFRKFAEWVARELFDDDWPHNMDAFLEVAWRKLSKLGLGDMAFILDNLILLRQIQGTGDCNVCKNRECKYMPKAGQMVRYNCPFYKAESEDVLDKIRAEIEQLPTNARTNWDGCCPDIDYPEIEYVDVTKAKLLEIIDKYKHMEDKE